MKAKLTFGKGNLKLTKNVATFSLPAGHTCPCAVECLAKVSRDGALEDSPHAVFRCFAANQERQYPNVRKARWNNLDLLKGKYADEMAELIKASLPKKTEYVRIHVSGDFFSASYFLAWCFVARDNPGKTFYAYTKNIPVWLQNKHKVPANLRLVASLGGKHDKLAIENGLPYAKVVYSVDEAERLGLEIDHDDSHAVAADKPFALLIHGGQKAGSEAGKIAYALRKSGATAYKNGK